VIYSYDKIQKRFTVSEQTYCPSSEILILYSQQMVFVILVMLNVH